MDAVLAFLISAADKVYLWFSDQFYFLYNGALNAWTWAVLQAGAALIEAKHYADNLFAAVQAAANTAGAWVQQQLFSIWTQLSTILLPLYNQVVQFIMPSILALTNAVNGLLATGSDILGSIRDTVMGWINGAIQTVISWVSGAYSWLLAVRQQIIDLLTWFTPANIAALINFVSGVLATIMNFLMDPLVWIFDLIWTYFLDFLFWVLATALGAVNATIPPTPPWRK